MAGKTKFRRRVLLTLEVETDAPLVLLQCAAAYWVTADNSDFNDGRIRGYDCKVLQAQANVVRPARSAAARKVKRG